MKIIINGKEEEINTELEKGERELDMLIPENEDIKDDISDTIEITPEELEEIKENVGNE